MSVSRTLEVRSAHSERVKEAAKPQVYRKIKLFFFCGRVAERRCVPVREGRFSSRFLREQAGEDT